MQVEDNRKAGQPQQTRKKPKTRILKWVLALAVVLIVLAFFLVPVFVSSEEGRRIILAKINDSIDGEANFAGLSMSWWRGIKVTDISFNDSAGQTFITVKQITTRPHYCSILMGSLSFGETVIDEPRVKINLRDKQLNKEGSGSSKTSAGEKLQSVVPPVKKIDLVVNSGNLKVTGRKGESVELSRINSKVNLRPPGQQTSFDIDMAVVDKKEQSRIRAVGKIRPGATRAGWSLKRTSSDFTVKLDALDLESLRPLFALMGKQVDAGGKLNADVEVKIDEGRFEKLQAKAVLSDLKKKISGKDVAVDESVRIETKIWADDMTVHIDKLNIESSFCKVDCRGRAERVDYVATADLKGVQEFAGQFANFGDYTMAGKVSAQGKMSFDKGAIKVSGQSTGRELVVSNGKITTPATLAKVDFDVYADTDKDILKIASAKAIAEPGEIQIVDSVVPLSDKAKGQFSVGVSAKVDLEKLQPFVGLLVSLPEGMKVGGALKSEVSVGMRKDAYHIVTDKTKVENLRIEQPGREPFQQKEFKLAVDMICNTAEKAIVINDLQLESSQIKIHKGQFSQVRKNGKTELRGRVDCEYDWAAVSTMTSPFLPKGLKLEGKRKDTIDFSSQYPASQTEKLLANLNTKGKLGFEKAQYMGLNFGPTEVDVQIQKGLLIIAPFSSTVNKGQFKFAGEADFKQKPTLLKTPGPIQIAKDIQINDETTRRLLMYLNPVFANAVNVSGVASLNCERLAIPLREATKNDLEVVGTISIAQLRLQAGDLLGQILSTVGTHVRGQNITIRPTRFVLQDGFLRYDDMQVDVGDNPVNFKGVIGLDKSLNMTVTLPYTLKGKTAKVDKETVGERISLPLRGTIDKPELDLGKLLEEQLKKQLEEELLKSLDKLFK